MKKFVEYAYQSFIAYLYRLIKRDVNSRHSRLRGSLEVYKEELGFYKSMKEPTEWVDELIKIVERAERHLESAEIDEAWKLLHSAKRLEILSGEVEKLRHRATILEQEATKLNDWRKEAVKKVLITVDPAPITKEQVFRAQYLIDEFYDNQAYRIKLRRKIFGFLFVLLSLATILIAYLLILPDIGLLNKEQLKHIGKPLQVDWLTILLVLAFGILGAAFSMAVTFTTQSIGAKIPDRVIGKYVTYLRPVIGAAAGLIVFVLLKSETIWPEFSKEIINNTWLIMSIAFASGFSEKLIIRTIEKVVTKATK